MAIDYQVGIELDQTTNGIELSRQQAINDWLALTAIHETEQEIIDSGRELLEEVEASQLSKVIRGLSETALPELVTMEHGGSVATQQEEEGGIRPLSLKGQKYIEGLFGPVDDLELTLDDTTYLAHLIVDLHSSTLKNRMRHKLDHKLVLQKNLEGYTAEAIVSMLPVDASVNAVSVILNRISKQLSEVYSLEGRKLILSSELEFYRRNPQEFKDEVTLSDSWSGSPKTQSHSKNLEDEEFIGNSSTPRRPYANHSDLSFLIDESEDVIWQEKALCAQTDSEVFFPEKGGSTRAAKRVCLSCDVRGECLTYAIDHDERFGIWGGLSERERRKLKKNTTHKTVTSSNNV